MRKFIKIQFDLGVPAIAVGLSAISLLALPAPVPAPARKGCRFNP